MKRTIVGPARMVLACALTVCACGAAHGGAVLDEILNYMYVDQSTPMHYSGTFFTTNRLITLTSDATIGQGFVAGLDADRLVRVWAHLRPDGDWQPGEGAKMTIYDTPKKTTELGSYTVWYDFRGFHSCVGEWFFDVQIVPGRTYYLVLSYVGDGDGRLCGIGVVSGSSNYDIMGNVIYVRADAPPGGDGLSWETAFNSIQDAVDARDEMAVGQGYLAGEVADFDLCFQTHVKRPSDRVGNLKKMFARFDLNRPELASIKSLVNAGDYEAAIATTVGYFEARETPSRIITPGYVPNPVPGYDRTEADLCIQNYYYYDQGIGYVGPDLNWRPALSFDANGYIIADSFDMNRFGPRGILTNAYLGTGDHKYAAKLNDLLVDWFMDNPPPEASGIGGAPIDSVWASLNTGIRLGHGFTAYDRAHSSPSFTTDCRMAYMLDLADHADTLVWNGADAGGNWSTTQNSSLLWFALDFMEFKNCVLWLDTACDRLAATMANDILPDGVEMESAPGYQRWMYYVPLLGVYQLLTERGVDTPFYAELKSALEKQAEYFMYLAAPNGFSPPLGDWGENNERGWLPNDAEFYDRPDMLYVGTAGAEGTKPAELSKMYPYAGTVTLRSHWGDTGEPFEDSRYLFFHGVHQGAHGHDDLNSITTYAYGREILTDPGSHIYGSPEHDLLTRAVSHNLMTIDGLDQGGSNDVPFRNWSTTPVGDFVAFRRPGAYDGMDYTREVFFVRTNDDGAQDYWVVRDIAGGSGVHQLQQRWHFNPCQVNVDAPTLTATSAFPDGGNMSIVQVTPSRLQVQQTTIDSWRPRGTGEPPVQLPTIIYRADTALPAAIDSLLLPFDGPQAPQTNLTTLETSADGLDCVFKFVQGGVQDIFAFQRVSGVKVIGAEGVTFEGERLFLRKINGDVRSAILINGKSLTVGGEQLLSFAQPLKWAAVEVGPGGSLTVWTSADTSALGPPGGSPPGPGDRNTTSPAEEGSDDA